MQDFSDLTIAEKRFILQFDNDSLFFEPNKGLGNMDFAMLKDKEFNRIVDQILGYRDFRQIEKARKVSWFGNSTLGKARWSGRSRSDGFSSSYRNIKTILKASGMKDGDTFVDIGSSYGRVGCVIGANFPNTRFIGYEIIRERFVEAQRVAELLKFDNVSYLCEDVSADDFTMPQADWFFLYDSLNKKTLARVLEKISRSVNNKDAQLMAKYNGNSSRYTDSPYLDFIAKTEDKDSFAQCWFYRFKQPER